MVNELERIRAAVEDYRRWDARTDDIHASLDEWELYQEAAAKLDEIAPRALDKLLEVATAAADLMVYDYFFYKEGSVFPNTTQCRSCDRSAGRRELIEHQVGCLIAPLETALNALTAESEGGNGES